MSDTSVSPPRRERDRGVRRVLFIVLGLNLSVAAVKLTLSATTGALSLLADGIHALLDASSNVVGIVGIAVASRPADAGHPYGHRRFETLAALCIGLLILSGMAGILRGLWEGIAGRRALPDVSALSAVVLAVTIAANFAISRYESRKGAELHSGVLQADADHTLSDTLGALAVLASFGAAWLGFRAADLVAAVVVALLIARTAWSVLRENIGVLADRARLDPLAVRDVALSIAEVRGAHKIRSRGSADHVHVDLHIHVDPSMTVECAHRVTHDVAGAVRAAFPEVADVLIHTEPADGRENDVASIAPSDPRLRA
ncbi:MAG TPA: cation diffusion facilitator family transporter [Polyangiaceae bacterium]|nr:cation diffusion facilitator family transporter [Polyangiaceae bacterium]